MAKFVGGPPPFVGTRDNLTIYLMKGEYIVRTKSSLTSKRVKRDPAFARTMENAGRLKKASLIASLIYRQMPADSRVYKQYRELVGKAMGLLKNGFDVEYVVIALEVAYLNSHLPELSAPLSKDNQAHTVFPMGYKLHGRFLFQTFAREYSSVKRKKVNRRVLRKSVYENPKLGYRAGINPI